MQGITEYAGNFSIEFDQQGCKIAGMVSQIFLEFSM
jgi:hypothetical protein